MTTLNNINICIYIALLHDHTCHLVMSVYVYIYIYVYMHINMHIYIYIMTMYMHAHKCVMDTL